MNIASNLLPYENAKALLSVIDTDLAVKWSLDNLSVGNLQIVLRAYKMPHDFQHAEKVLSLMIALA
jgi:hypothetical protein